MKYVSIANMDLCHELDTVRGICGCIDGSVICRARKTDAQTHALRTEEAFCH